MFDPSRPELTAMMPDHLATALVEDIRQRCFGSAVAPRCDWPSGAFVRYVVVSTERLDIAAATALYYLDPMLEPCTPEVAVRELSRLGVSCVPRREDPDSGELRAAAFLECVSPYPTDVVIWACRAWVRQPPEIGKWYPSWAELRDMCEKRVIRRRALAEICRRILAPGPLVSDGASETRFLRPEASGDLERS